MRLSIERLRGVLISGAVLLLVVLAVYIGYGRYRAFVFYRNILKKNGITIGHDSNGVTFSQALGQKTVFTLRAARVTPAGDRKWTLHDAELTLYSRAEQGADQRADHISSAEIEWDEKLGIARALGEVHMDLQAPQAIGGRSVASSNGAAQTPPPQAASSGEIERPGTIHVRTSGLVYLRKLGVAATDQPVEFRYGDLLCTARGAEFNTAESNLHLLAEVAMAGMMKGKPVRVTATRADLDRAQNVATLQQPVLTSLDRSAQSTSAVIDLRPDGSLEHVLARGNVVLRAPAEQIAAATLQASFTPQSVAQIAVLTGGVTLTGTDPQRPVQGVAHQVDLQFTPQGAPATIVATGSASLATLDRRSLPAGLSRRVQGERIVARFLAGPRAAGTRSQSAQLAEVDATGSPSASAESLATTAPAMPPATPSGASHTADSSRRKTTQVAADTLRLLFAPGLGPAGASASQPRQLLGIGHTHLQQDAPAGAQQVSTGDTLQVDFAQAAPNAPLAIETAVQSGHVAVRSRAATQPNKPAPATTIATADRATYEGATERLTLAGSVHLSNPSAELLATTVVLDQLTDTADATGNVQATLVSDPAHRGLSSTHETAPTHILSASAHFERAGRLAQFRGTDAEPARLWQQASQVQAATLLFDGDRHTFSARPLAAGGLVRAVFAATPSPASPKPTASAGRPRAPGSSVVRVSSPRMDYSDLDHEAVFSGVPASAQNVQIDTATGRAQAGRAVVLLAPVDKAKPAPAQANPVGGSLDRVILTGDVQLLQPGRHGTGDQLVYTAATGDYVLTGSPTRPPHIVDAQQGSLTGATLLFSDSGSTIVVTGAPEPQTRAGRVHTETPVRSPSR